MKYGENIRSIRTARGMTQEELAKAVGVTQGAIAHIESGVRSTGVRRLEQIARALDVSLLQLMEDTPQPLEPEANR